MAFLVEYSNHVPRYVAALIILLFGYIVNSIALYLNPSTTFEFQSINQLFAPSFSPTLPWPIVYSIIIGRLHVGFTAPYSLQLQLTHSKVQEDHGWEHESLVPHSTPSV